VKYLEWIQDGKENPELTNLEKNVYMGLQDVPTLTELAVLTLYAQAISHPYMRAVRKPGYKQVNMLDLGPLHANVQSHLQKIIQDSSILLASEATYELGAMDGKLWHNTTAMHAVHKLIPTLPHLKPVLVAFAKEH